MSEKLRRIAESNRFQGFIIGVIVLAGVVVGFETYPAIAERHHGLLHFLNQAVLWVFVVEIAIKMGAEGKRPWRYFGDPWNIFDFSIVAVCFLPLNAQYVAVLRLARLLRVLRLVKALPKLQVLVGALLKSLPSMGYIAILLLLLFYLYAVLGTFLFGPNDPVNFGSLQQTFLTLYQTATFEGWIDRMNVSFYGCNDIRVDYAAELCTAPRAAGWWAAAYFVSFTVLATMVILNLFIGVIVGGMEEAQEELAASLRKDEAQAEGALPLAGRLKRLSEQLEEIREELHALSEDEGKAEKR